MRSTRFATLAAAGLALLASLPARAQTPPSSATYAKASTTTPAMPRPGMPSPALPSPTTPYVATSMSRPAAPVASVAPARPSAPAAASRDPKTSYWGPAPPQAPPKRTSALRRFVTRMMADDESGETVFASRDLTTGRTNTSLSKPWMDRTR